MNFNVIHTMPEEMEDMYPLLQDKKGYYIMLLDKVYIFIGAGIKPKEGYQIAVSKVILENNSLIVDVTETAPEGGKLYKPNPSYPYTVLALDISKSDFTDIKSTIVRNTTSLKTYDLINL